MTSEQIYRHYLDVAGDYLIQPHQLTFAAVWFAGNDLIKAYVEAEGIDPKTVNLLPVVGKRKKWLKEAEGYFDKLFPCNVLFPDEPRKERSCEGCNLTCETHCFFGNYCPACEAHGCANSLVLPGGWESD